MAVFSKKMADKMSDNPEKTQVLSLLKQQGQPVALSVLLEKAGSAYNERTLRRWLAEWVVLGLVQKSGQKRGTVYWAADAEQAHQTGYFSFQSEKALLKINQPYALRKPVSYHADWLMHYRPNKDAYLPAHLISQWQEVGNRSHHQKPAGTYAKQIYQRLLIDLSYNSSRLEGNTYSLLDTKRLLIEGIAAPGKLNEERTMILNHQEAIRFIVDKRLDRKLDEQSILTLHYLLSDGLVAPEYAGKVRDHGVRIGGSAYLPLENSKQLVFYLKEICVKANAIENAYERSFFLLVHIAYLQAFVDVNKRTSRLSANIPLIENNLTPLAFDGIQQEDYTSAMLAIYELNDVQPLVDLYHYSYLRTAALYDVTVEAIMFDRVRVQYREQRRAVIRHIILNHLHGEAALNYIESQAKHIAEPEDVSQCIQNARDDLATLGLEQLPGLGVTQKELQAWVVKEKEKR
jgi:Fic family protein